jgi:inhibitor of cysteine peptidase
MQLLQLSLRTTSRPPEQLRGQQVEKMRVQSERHRRKYVKQACVYVFFVVFGIVLFLLSSCGTTNTGGNVMSTITLTQADKGKSITVHTGDEIVIMLPENPTTGYRWAIDQTDENMLIAQTPTFSSTPGGAIGSGGTRTFTFTAKQPGTAHLQLKLLRAWQGDSSIIDRYDVTIQVQS